MAKGNIILLSDGRFCIVQGHLVIDDGNQKIPFKDFDEWTLTVTKGRARSRIVISSVEVNNGETESINANFVTEYEEYYPTGNNSALVCEDPEIPLSCSNEKGSASVSFTMLGCGNMRTRGDGTIVLPVLFACSQVVNFSDSSDAGTTDEWSLVETRNNYLLWWEDVEFSNPEYDGEGNLVPQDSESINFNFIRTYVGTNGQSCSCGSTVDLSMFFFIDPGNYHINSGDLFS